MGLSLPSWFCLLCLPWAKYDELSSLFDACEIVVGGVLWVSEASEKQLDISESGVVVAELGPFLSLSGVWYP